MPVLGVGGVLEFRRELPEPVLVSPDAAALHVNGINVNDEGFWTGDKVWVYGPRGLPFDLNEDGLPDVQGGWGMFFGSKYGLYGARKTRLTSGAAKWFGSEAPFRSAPVPGLVDRTELYVYRDELDRLSFYTSFADALRGDTEARLTLFPVDFRFLLIAPVGSTGYQQRLEPTYPEIETYRLPPERTEIRLSAVSTAALPEPTGYEADRPWTFVAEMDEWSLELDATSIETTGLGDRFGENTKALVTGGGQVDFFVNRHQTSTESDSTFLAQLLITLEEASKAEAIFNVTTKAADAPSMNGNRRLPIANVAYRAQLLLVSCVTNTAADDLIRGSARFVTVGRIRLDIS